MPTKKSQCYNFTFRPSLQEWDKYKESFLKNFQKQFGKEKYLISQEKGTSEVYNHFQGFIELTKEKRADTFRTAFHRVIKDFIIAYPKVALKITPIVRDVSICQGYILKEIQADKIEDFISGDFPILINQGYSIEYLLQVNKDYESLTNDKKLILDKVRVNARNFYVIFTRYVEVNTDKIKEYGYDLRKTKDTEFLMKRMVQDGYYCFDLLLNPKRFTNIAMNVSLLYNDDIGDGKKRIMDS